MVIIPYAFGNDIPIAINEACYLLFQRTDGYFSKLEDDGSGLISLTAFNDPAPTNVATATEAGAAYPNFWVEPTGQTMTRYDWTGTDLVTTTRLSYLPSFLVGVNSPSGIYAGWRVVIGSFTENKVYFQVQVFPTTQPSASTYTPQTYPAANTMPLVFEISSVTKPNGDLFFDIAKMVQGFAQNIAEFAWETGSAEYVRYMRRAALRLNYYEYVPASLSGYMTGSPATYSAGEGIDDSAGLGFPQIDCVPMVIPDGLTTSTDSLAMFNRPFLEDYLIGATAQLEGKLLAMPQGTGMYWINGNNTGAMPFTVALHKGAPTEQLYIVFTDFAETVWSSNAALTAVENVTEEFRFGDSLLAGGGGDAKLLVSNLIDTSSEAVPVTVRECTASDLADCIYIKWANTAGGASYWLFDSEIKTGIPESEGTIYGIPQPDYISAGAFDPPGYGYAFPFGGAARTDIRPMRTYSGKSRNLSGENIKYLSDIQRAGKVWYYDYAAAAWLPVTVQLEPIMWTDDKRRFADAKITVKITDYATK